MSRAQTTLIERMLANLNTDDDQHPHIRGLARECAQNRHRPLDRSHQTLASAVAAHCLSMGDDAALALARERAGIDQNQPCVLSSYEFCYAGAALGCTEPLSYQPIFKFQRSSGIPFDEACALFDATKLASLCLLMSPNVHIETYTYDDVTQEGSVTLFKQLGSDKSKHVHLTVPFSKPNFNVQWYHCDDDAQLDLAQQVALNTLLQETVHLCKNRSLWPTDRPHGQRCSTRCTVENCVIHSMARYDAADSVHASTTSTYVTSPDWADTPVFRRVWQDREHLTYDIQCRAPGAPKWHSLQAALNKRTRAELKDVHEGRHTRKAKITTEF